jgi:hypothetical protein
MLSRRKNDLLCPTAQGGQVRKHAKEAPPTWLMSMSAARGISAAADLPPAGACLKKEVRRSEGLRTSGWWDGRRATYEDGCGASSPSSRRACIVMLSFFFEPSVSVAPFLSGAALGREASKEGTGSSLSICGYKFQGGKGREKGRVAP